MNLDFLQNPQVKYIDNEIIELKNGISIYFDAETIKNASFVTTSTFGGGYEVSRSTDLQKQGLFEIKYIHITDSDDSFEIEFSEQINAEFIGLLQPILPLIFKQHHIEPETFEISIFNQTYKL